MTGSPEADPDWAAIEGFLASHGAADIPHPGGTLLEHLVRVRRRLTEWAAPPEVQMAGLCHATYGTDGFPTGLLGTDQRAVLVALIGEPAEELAYLYGSCARESTYPQFGGQFPVVFRDRFTGAERTPPFAQTQAFAEITVANELDVLTRNPQAAEKHAASLLRLFRRMSPLLSRAAELACTTDLAPLVQGDPDRDGEQEARETPGITVVRLDHLVLTVADVDRTIEFYERALGMEAVTFGPGRRALVFGSSKINLHQAGSEFAPHAAHPMSGSADLCLVTHSGQPEVLRHLATAGIPVEQGPVPRTGALGPMSSTYIRDPDGNLVEISTYDSPQTDG